MTREDAAPERAALAFRRAARARERARKAEKAAETQERLAVGTGRVVFIRSAEVLRRVAASHQTSARLHEAFASRLLEQAQRRGEPAGGDLFMVGVADLREARSAAFTLVAADRSQLSVAASDRKSRAAQELEFVLDEGPTRDVTTSCLPVSASGTEIDRRWPGYGPGLLALGLGSVLAVPARGRGPDSCVGTLAVFGSAGGAGAEVQVAECAEGLVRAVLLDPDADPGLYGGVDLRVVVHQAAGMLAVQIDRPIPDALELIKAHAFASGTSTEAVARRIVDGELRICLESS